MTATVTEITSRVIGTDLAMALGAIVILLLLVLLIEREFVRARGSSRTAIWEKTLAIAIVPLLFAFGLIVITHIVESLSGS